MPIYEYQCQSCGHRFEEMQRLADPVLTSCPQCEGELKKLVSAPAFQFKGSGWYVTDYADKKGSDSSDGAAKGESGGGSSDTSSEKSSDKPSKTAPKSDGGGSKDKGSSGGSSKES